jgi:hypothetical protein
MTLANPSLTTIADRRVQIRSRTAELLVFGMLCAGTYLQKLGILYNGNQIFLATALIAGFTGIGPLFGLRLQLRRALALVGAFSVLLMNQLFIGGEFSAPSFLLLSVYHLPYIFQFRPGDISPGAPIRMFRNIAVVISIAGMVQFVAQFIVGIDLAFAPETYIPEFIIRYNNMNPLSYGSHIIKSNGFFLIEPSLLSQLCAIAIVVEIVTERSLRRLALYAGGLIVSYSGTGLILLALILPVFIIRQRRIGLLLTLVVMGGAILLFAQQLNLAIFVDRVNEFNSTHSSAYARFLSPFQTIKDFYLNDTQSFLFGTGAGSYRYIAAVARRSYASHDPTWAKVFFEYGMIGAIAYFSFFCYCIFSVRQDSYIKTALFLQFMILGGYILTPFVHALILGLLIWPGFGSAAEARAIRKPKIRGPVGPPRPMPGSLKNGGTTPAVGR